MYSWQVSELHGWFERSSDRWLETWGTVRGGQGNKLQGLRKTSEHLVLSARKPVSLADERSCRTKGVWEKGPAEVRSPGINGLQGKWMKSNYLTFRAEKCQYLLPGSWGSKKGSWGGKMMDSGIHHSPRGQFLTAELPSVLFKDCSVIYFNQ